MRIRLGAAAGGLAIVVLAGAGCAFRGEVAPPVPRETFREGTGRTIVMLGGGIYGAGMFAPHARELASRFDVIRVQTLNVQAAQRGAAMPADYSVAGECAALRQALDDLGVNGRVDVVGSSYGAVIALHFAMAYPERVRTVTLFEPPAFWVLQDSEFDRDPALREMRELTAKVTPAVTPSDQQLVRFRCLLGPCPPAIPGPADAARAEWDLGRASMRGLSAIAEHREDRSRLARLPPVLVITGAQTVPFHRRINELLAKEIPGVETAQIPGGHGAPRTSQSAFLDELRAFLARHP
jgi:pimeloyl-ACP methyl ester carboxylesterase